jgi:phenylalanyl-tRNA synthetase beta chain
MRQTLLYGCLESVIYNLNRRNSDLKLFEFGRVYALSDNPAEPLSGYHEETHLALVMTGQLIGENWNAPAVKTSFFDLKGVIMTVLLRTGLTSGKLSYESFSNSLFSEGLTIFSGGTFLGHFGLLSDNQLKSFDIKQPVFYAEVNWTALLEGVSSKNISYRGIPKFPEVRRDLALLVDQTVTFGQMESLAYKTEPKLLRNVGLFDVYEGDKIDSGKKSYALNFILRDDEKTLTDKDIEKVMGRLVKAFNEQFNAQLR